LEIRAVFLFLFPRTVGLNILEMNQFVLIILTITLFSCSEERRFDLLDSNRTGVKFVNRVNDMDSYPDVILTGSDHSYDISTGYYDANKGILLLSRNGQPINELLSPSQSGFMLQGMVGSLLFLEGDAALLVTGLNRKKASVFSLSKATAK